MLAFFNQSQLNSPKCPTTAPNLHRVRVDSGGGNAPQPLSFPIRCNHEVLDQQNRLSFTMDVAVAPSPVVNSSNKGERRRRRRERRRKAKNEAEQQLQMHDNPETSDKTRDYKLVNGNSETNLLKADLTVKPLGGNPLMNSSSTETPLEGNTKKKRKKRSKKNKKKAIIEGEAPITGQINDDVMSTENPVEVNEGKVNKKATVEEEVPSIGQTNVDVGSTENLVVGNVTGKRKRNRKKIMKEEIKDLKITHLPITSVRRRKLLVLDVNGILADIVLAPEKQCRGDTRMSGRAIYRRPFYDDFLKFCFQNFDVGIWSSRSTIILHKVVDYLLGDLKSKLLFCWDISQSTHTGFKTLEDHHKPLVCKELKKIWMIYKGYNESNTLLLDDSPYKALLNPLHTTVFPYPYRFRDGNDNSLGPGGSLRVYLEGLLTSKNNTQKYVEQHPFGQRAIDERHSSWGFYSGVINAVSNRLKKL